MFDTVRINLTVTSKGRQYDRLASLYVGDTEVFRTSTAEPTPDGIVWTYIKDLSAYNALWKQPQTVIFDLGNIITDVYTGPFDVAITAHFSFENNVPAADIILPISAKKSSSGSSSEFQLPSDNATVSYTIPVTTSRAILSISACGQSDEEFWWSNVLSSDIETFESTYGELYGYSPFREVQLYIDGLLAGVVWPFPVIFTGGVAPGLWKPIVGLEAFDLRQPEIDISPFLPLLTDGKEHSFQIKIAGLDVSESGVATLNDSAVGSYWPVTGTIFLYLGGQQSPMASVDSIVFDTPAPVFNVTRNLVQDPNTGANVSLTYSVTAERKLGVVSPSFSWNQTLSFSNSGLYDQQGYNQENSQTASGVNIAWPVGGIPREVSFQYPLAANQTYGASSNLTIIDASIDRGLHFADSGGLPGVSTYTLTSGPSYLYTDQVGKAHYEAGSGGWYVSLGDTTSDFWSMAASQPYERHVRAINTSVVSDSNPV